MKQLNSSELAELECYLYYFHVSELKKICDQFQFSSSGKKKDLILRILAYLKSGKKEVLMEFPECSKACKGETYPLQPTTKMLIGAYKNDLATRMFFKELIGEYFHFTAFGIDWINERWAKGDPPTYQEFASFWKREYTFRKLKKAKPKTEWAYLNFIQRCSKEHPEFSGMEMVRAWKLERNTCVQKARTILDKIS